MFWRNLALFAVGHAGKCCTVVLIYGEPPQIVAFSSFLKRLRFKILFEHYLYRFVISTKYLLGCDLSILGMIFV